MNNRVDIHLSGLSTRPSDYACKDGDLAVCHNLINEGGELKPIFPLKTSFAIPPNHTIRFTHKTSDGTVYIFRKSVKVGGVTTVSWYYCNENGHTGSSPDESGTPMFTAWVSAGTGDLKKLEQDSDGNVLLGDFDTINSIGNILIFTDAKGLDSYFRYTNGAYKFLGHHLPDLPNIVFSLKTLTSGSNDAILDQSVKDAINGSEEKVYCKMSMSPVLDGSFTQAPYLSNDESIDSYYSAGYAVLARDHNLRAAFGAFDQPFFVRYALRMYDGSYSRISPPVLMVPTDKAFLPKVSYTFGTGNIECTFSSSTAMSFLFYRVIECPDMSDWEGIISGVDVFVSSPLYTYDPSADTDMWMNQGYRTFSKDFGNSYGCISQLGYNIMFESSDSIVNDIGSLFDDVGNTSGSNAWTEYFTPLFKSGEDIKKEIENLGPFYKVASLDGLNRYGSAYILDGGDSFKPVNIPRNTLTSLESREALTDDYIVNYNIRGRKFVYNSRLLAFDCSRDYTTCFGFSSMRQYVHSDTTHPSVHSYVSIIKGGNKYLLDITQEINDMNFTEETFFYPDPDAESITFAFFAGGGSGGVTMLKKYNLTRHPILNCSYYNNGLVKTDISYASGTAPTGPSPDNVPLMSRVYMSEVDNPFVFPAGLTCTAGSGTVMALAATTLPISEGQQGQFPVMAFTDDGIWALSISSTGSITATNPMLRDVLLSREQLCNIDNGVVYATEKGIMMLVGGRSTCITSKLEDDFFNTADLTYTNYLQTEPVKLASNFNSASKLPAGILPSGSVKDWIGSCRIYYASGLNRLIVSMPSNDVSSQVGSNSSSAALVYSIGSGEWSTMSWGKYTDAYNSYPYTFVHNAATKTVTGTGVGSTLTTTTTHVNVVPISSEDKDSLQTCVALTRPLKLTFKDMPKTVFEAVVRGTFSVYAMPQIWDGINMKWNRIKRPSDLTCALYGSNNLTDWFLINYAKAEFLRGQTGTPFKYFRLLIVADKTLSGVESITGATFDVQQRLNDTLR